MSTEASAAPTKYSEMFPIKAPAARVFTALTSEPELRIWLAENVRIEPRVGGKYRFWGKRTPWVPSESDADGVITKFDSPRQLSFRWTIRGCPSETDLLIASYDETCELMVKHSATGTLWPRVADAPWVLADFWKVMIGNLRHYLAKGTPALVTDFTPTSGEVVLSIDIDAPPEKVWEALIDPAKMNKWLAKDAVNDRVVGGNFTYGWTDKSGKIMGPTMLIDIVPNRRLEHDWRYENEPNTRVRWQLTKLPAGGTRVTLTHTKFDEPTTRGGYVQGWAAFLIALKTLTDKS